MPNIHIVQCDDPKYLPFARSRLKQIRANGLAYASQQYTVDGVTIHVRKEGEQEFIRITGGRAIWMLVTVHQLPYTDDPLAAYDAWGFFPLPATRRSSSKLFSFAAGVAITAKNASLYYAGFTDRTYNASHYDSGWEYYLDMESYTQSNSYGALTGFAPYGGRVLTWHTTPTYSYTTYNDHVLNHGWAKTRTRRTEIRGLVGGTQTLTYLETESTDSVGGVFGSGIYNTYAHAAAGPVVLTDIVLTGDNPASITVPPEQLAHFTVVLDAQSPSISHPPVIYRIRTASGLIEADPAVVSPITLTLRTSGQPEYTRREVGTDYGQDKTHIYRPSYYPYGGTLGLFSRRMEYIHAPVTGAIYLNGVRYVAPYTAPAPAPGVPTYTGEFISGDILLGPNTSEVLDLRSIPAIAADPVFMDILNNRQGAFAPLTAYPNTFSAYSAPAPLAAADGIIRVQFIVDQKLAYA